jgi:hypothetical protein
MRLIATVDDPGAIRGILAHLGLWQSGQSPGPAPSDRHTLSSQVRGGINSLRAPARGAVPLRAVGYWYAWSLTVRLSLASIAVSRAGPLGSAWRRLRALWRRLPSWRVT